MQDLRVVDEHHAAARDVKHGRRGFDRLLDRFHQRGRLVLRFQIAQGPVQVVGRIHGRRMLGGHEPAALRDAVRGGPRGAFRIPQQPCPVGATDEPVGALQRGCGRRHRRPARARRARRASGGSGTAGAAARPRSRGPSARSSGGRARRSRSSTRVSCAIAFTVASRRARASTRSINMALMPGYATARAMTPASSIATRPLPMTFQRTSVSSRCASASAPKGRIRSPVPRSSVLTSPASTTSRATIPLSTSRPGVRTRGGAQAPDVPGSGLDRRPAHAQLGSRPLQGGGVEQRAELGVRLEK